MGKFDGKKLLVLAGKPIGSCEIVEHAKSHGAYTIVTDYLDVDKSEAKKISHENWDISTADIEKIEKRVKENNIDGIYSGVHEFNIGKMIQICEHLGLPCYCTLEQWQYLNNKKSFKQLCKENCVPVTQEYEVSDFSQEELSKIKYPVIIKPVDGSGSRGFSICNNEKELELAYYQAKKFSETGKVIIEKFMKYENSVIINYTVLAGEIYFSGISDKYSKKILENGAPVMAIQYYPSFYEQKYLTDLNEKVKKMFKSYGIKNGVIWIEAFCDNGEFTFNEMGYRFGGSLTYFPVKYLYGVDQLAIQIEYAINGKNCESTELNENSITNDVYCILPVHVKPGVISEIIGFDELLKKEFVNTIVYVHFLGEKIDNWGSAQQVFAYLHLIAKSREEINNIIDNILEKLSIKGENGEELLFNIYKG